MHINDEIAIRWGSLHRIMRALLMRERVDITLTTRSFRPVGSGSGNIASAVFNDREVDILLNARECETLDMVIRALAHEGARALLVTDRHDGDFERIWDDMERKIRDAYDAPGGKRPGGAGHCQYRRNR